MCSGAVQVNVTNYSFDSRRLVRTAPFWMLETLLQSFLCWAFTVFYIYLHCSCYFMPWSQQFIAVIAAAWQSVRAPVCVCVQQVHSRYVSALRKWKLWPALISTKQSIATNQAAKSILREPTGQPALHILALLLRRRSPVMQAAGLLTQRSASEVGEHMSADTGS